MTIHQLEFRGDNLEEAATKLIAGVKESNIGERQILSIDAQCSCNDLEQGQCILCLHFDTDIDPVFQGDINFKIQDGGVLMSLGEIQAGEHVTSLGENQNGEVVTSLAEDIPREDMISITGTGCDKCSHDMIIFYCVSVSNGGKDNCRIEPLGRNLKYCETRAKTWSEAARNILDILKNEGVKDGQVVNLCAFGKDKNEEVKFRAYWNASLPDLGELKIQFTCIDTTVPWEDSKIQIISQLHIVSITAVTNKSSYVFFQQDEILNIEYNCLKGFIQDSETRFLAKQMIKTGKSNNEVSINVNENISSYSIFCDESGSQNLLTFGAEFQTILPSIKDGKIGLHDSSVKCHVWGVKINYNVNFDKDYRIQAPQNSIVSFYLKIKTAELTVPCSVKFRSGKVIFGTWKGSSAWKMIPGINVTRRLEEDSRKLTSCFLNIDNYKLSKVSTKWESVKDMLLDRDKKIEYPKTANPVGGVI